MTLCNSFKFTVFFFLTSHGKGILEYYLTQTSIQSKRQITVDNWWIDQMNACHTVCTSSVIIQLNLGFFKHVLIIYWIELKRSSPKRILFLRQIICSDTKKFHFSAIWKVQLLAWMDKGGPFGFIEFEKGTHLVVRWRCLTLFKFQFPALKSNTRLIACFCLNRRV